jgi:hypothetical protein
VRGTAPTRECQQHFFFAPTAELAAAISVPGGAGGNAVMPQAPAMAPDAPATAANAHQAPSDLVVAPEREEEPKKKRGFWAKVFGRGNDKENTNQDVADKR